MANTRLVPFLYDFVTGEFFTFRTWDRDVEATALAERAEKAGAKTEGLAESLADVCIYTRNLTFNWHPETPPELRGLETFWGMYRNGQEADAFRFFCAEVDAAVLVGARPAAWTDAELREYIENKPPDVTVKNWLDNRPVRQAMRGWQDAFAEALRRWTPPAQLIPPDDADPL